MTLRPTTYKIYAAALVERLRIKVEEKGILSKSQASFRRGMGTVHQIYALNYLVNRQIRKKRGKMTVTFVDLWAAFDIVDREMVIKLIRVRERGGGGGKSGKGRTGEKSKKDDDRVEEQSEKVGKEVGKEFCTTREVKQRCPLSPMLFNILIADLEEKLERGE